ncbi:hypothetical protein OH805_37735 [Streptomyces sp. NBC_00879]|nr:hypothetical protein OH805_37735 [Streptomyces sp. NBC_00879]
MASETSRHAITEWLARCSPKSHATHRAWATDLLAAIPSGH